MTTYRNEDLLSAKNLLSHRVLGRENTGAHGVGVAWKKTCGSCVDQKSIVFFVECKKPKSKLGRGCVLPGSIDGIPTDVVQAPLPFMAGQLSAIPRVQRSLTDGLRRKRRRPVIAGISAAHRHVNAGTIGSFCRSTRSNDNAKEVYVLGNNHVFAKCNDAVIGDALYQCAPGYGGTAADHFADLSRFVRLEFGVGKTNRVDAALGTLLPEVNYDPQIAGIGAVRGTRRAYVGMHVRKHGSNTGYTEGIITTDSYDTHVGLDYRDPSKIAVFVDTLRIEPLVQYDSFGIGGDSGALVVDESDPTAVGLYFAGSRDGSYGLANPIDAVLEELEIEIL